MNLVGGFGSIRHPLIHFVFLQRMKASAAQTNSTTPNGQAP